MRDGALRILTLLLASTAASAGADAEARPAVTIAAAHALTEGPAQLEVIVTLGPGRTEPLLLDVKSEGEALQVVRGRFVRADARSAAEGTLRFLVPIVVRAQGSAIVRVELLTYRCQKSCREQRASARRTIAVGPLVPPGS